MFPTLSPKSLNVEPGSEKEEVDMEDNNKVTPSQGKECFRAGACKVARKGKPRDGFP